MRSRFAVMVGAGVAIALAGTVIAVTVPSGERQLGRTVIEPAYDDVTGQLMYLSTPIGVPFPSKSNPHSFSPLYIIAYPTSAASSVGLMNCQHEDAGNVLGDNCPDHGNDIADAAQAIMPTVYSGGVWGHDHLGDAPGGHLADARGGRDFNVAWNVVLVLFTNEPASHTHITTEAQLEAAFEDGDAVPVDLQFAFNCSVVSATTYARATALSPN